MYFYLQRSQMIISEMNKTTFITRSNKWFSNSFFLLQSFNKKSHLFTNKFKNKKIRSPKNFSSQSDTSWNVLYWYHLWRETVILELGFISGHLPKPRFNDFCLFVLLLSKHNAKALRLSKYHNISNLNAFLWKTILVMLQK